MDRAEGGGCRQQNVGPQQPDDRQQPQRLVERALRILCKGRILMGNERTDAAHVGRKVANETQIARKVGLGLKGRADHKPGADLIADFPQIGKAAHPVVKRERRRMQLFVVCFGCGFVPQQITVGPGGKEQTVALFAAFAERKRHSAVGVRGFELVDQIAQKVVGRRAVFTPLQNERAKAEAVALVGAVENLRFRQPVAVGAPVAAADPAIVAVVFANVADLNQHADKDAVAVDLFAYAHGGIAQQRVGFPGAFRKQRFKGGGVQIFTGTQGACQRTRGHARLASAVLTLMPDRLPILPASAEIVSCGASSAMEMMLMPFWR